MLNRLDSMQKKTITVNGTARTVIAKPKASLGEVLRNQLGLTGVKIGCGMGECGACSVLVDGRVVRSCMLPMESVEDGARITTIEGVGTPEKMHPLQLAWTIHGASQCGFCSPGFIVSAKALLDENPAPTRREVREWFQKHRNACRCTGYKPQVDAVMDAARLLRGEINEDSLKFDLPPDGRIFGGNYPRPNAVAKATGTWDFGADIGRHLPPGTLTLALVQAEVSHARILSIDTSAAEAMPGIYKVVTHRDVKGKNRISGLLTLPTNLGDGWDRPILCDEKVFQFGDTIAIVCGDTEENAKEAAGKVKVQLEVLPAYMNAPEAMAPEAREIHPGTPNVYFEVPLVKGKETGPLMERAAFVVQDDFYVGRQPHLPMEPDVGFAYFDEEERLTIHSKSAGIHLHHAMICPGLGIEPNKLRLVQNPSGGTFGYKLSPTIEGLLGAACMATGKPVFLKYDCVQQIISTGKRSPFFVNVKFGADKCGRIFAMESDWTVDHGPYSEFGDLLTVRGAQFIGAAYGIPNIRGRGRTVCTNHTWGSAFRASGASQSQFASEVLMDELAEKMGMDPLEIRYLNVYRPGDTTPTGCRPDVFSLPDMIGKLRPLYAKALVMAKRESTLRRKRGVGVSIGICGGGLDGSDSSEVWVELTPKGAAVGISWSDHGQGSDVGCLATAHEALRPLGLSPARIRLVPCESVSASRDGRSDGSHSLVRAGQAVKTACEMLLKSMKKPGGGYRTYDEMKAESIPLRYYGARTASGSGECDLSTAQGNPYPVYMYGVFMSEVEVDIETGKTEVLKMTLVADIGKVVNQLVVAGQIYGGLAQGIGLALSEEFENVKKHTSLTACGLPYIQDVPDQMEILYVETPRALGPFGAAGVGELGLTSPHASIVNAIHHACGVRITSLPALPEKVLAGIFARERRGRDYFVPQAGRRR